MKHDFTEKLDRRNTDCWKWDVEKAEFSMGVADTDFRIPQPVTEALVEKVQSGALAYGSGPQKFYNAVSSFYQRRYNFIVDPSNIRYAPGLMVALKLLCEAFTMPGDQIILQPPVYHAFAATIEKAGRHVLNNPLKYDEVSHTYSIDFEDLEEKAKKHRARMMIVCNPHNPACKAFTKEELIRIFEICHKNDVLVISDEVHGDIYYDNYKHHCFHSLSDKIRDNSIVMSADGKTFNLHGFYTSYLLIPNEKLRAAYDRAYEYNHFDYNVMGCLAAEVAYGGACDYYIDGLKEYLHKNKNYLVDFLNKNDIGVSMAQPQATYLMWLDFRRWNLSNQELHKLLLSNGIWLGLGEKFGPGGETFMRMNIACHHDTLVDALDRLKAIYENHILKNC